MNSEDVSERTLWVLLFVLLTVLMVVAGAHLLETVAYSFFGPVQRILETPQEGGVSFRSRADGPLGWIHQGYRYTIAAVFLVLGYHALGLKAWARVWLVRALLLDLLAWLLHALRYMTAGQFFVLSHEQILLEIAIVALEGGLLWLLSQPGAVGHFARKKIE